MPTDSLKQQAEIQEVEDPVKIPMRGVKQSLNVSVATGVAGYEFSRIYCNERK